MRANRVRNSPVHTKVVKMEGGLNENVSSLELKGGELISGVNYQFAEGTSGGYVSISGFERYDGQPKPSEVPATSEDDTAREAARALIGEVPGAGPVLGVTVWKGSVYAIRADDEPATAASMYIESASGWVLVVGSLPPGGEYSFIHYNFLGSSDTEVLLWTDGVGPCRMLDGVGAVTLISTGFTPDEPINLIVHAERLWLAYRGGNLNSSAPGDPTDWGLLSLQWGIGAEITDLIAGVGNALLIYCERLIKILEGVDEASFAIKTFSDTSGSYHSTAKRLFGTVFFMDDRGVTSMEAVQEFGDFASNSMSQKVYRTLQENKNNITEATVNRSLNQYRLFFNNGYSVFFSFHSKKLRGVTLIQFPIPVITVAEGRGMNKSDIIVFTSLDGYVYQMDSGTSFDGLEIATVLSPAFYHYGTPRLWKKFKSIEFEIDAVDEISIDIKVAWDYNKGHLPKDGENIIDILSAGAPWGTAEWGNFVWSSGSSITNRLIYYIKGIGSNMGMTLRTSSAYSRPHTIQNFITDFTLGRRQL